MLSKNKIQLIKSLERRKERKKQNLFVAEGPKLVGELLTVDAPALIVCSPAWFLQNKHLLPSTTTTDIVTDDELRRASLQQHPQEVIALFHPRYGTADLNEAAADDLVLALDGIQDPGNLGTIVRLADWFGIRHIFCSEGTADIYNPKAVQATMGAIGRVALQYGDLAAQLRAFAGPIFGTHLCGDDIYRAPLSHRGVIVMGNEGKGISDEISALVTQRLFIPPYPSGSDRVESLNVAIATAITCAEFRRRAGE
ncbi:MAG: RNA methyltransferase [Bacteroidaceae bacterium]|nr:RNA methyltransferase [Bacteroidaceae bacterium]